MEYHYAYKNFVIKVYGYMDLTFQDISLLGIVSLCIIAVLPITLYRGFRNISSALSIFTYIFIYIPFVETIYTAVLPLEIRLSYGILFLCLMALFFMTDGNTLFSIAICRKRGVWSFRSLELIVIMLMLIAVFFNIGSIRFVNILSQADLMYELRADNNASRSSAMAYLISWLGHAFIPFLLVTYYVEKKKIKFLLTIAAYLLIFMMDMQKITFLIPFVMWLLLYINSKHKEKLRKYFHIVLMVGLLLPSYLCCKFYDRSPAMLGISTLIVLRTQCIAGEQLDRYLNFFDVKGNPYTNYAHINAVNVITKSYPYGNQSIGQVVAGDGSNSNATFLLMDGVAAKGLIGTLFSGLLFIIFKSIMNSLGKKYDDMYIIIIMFFGIFSMLNTSLFTSILSFGFLIVYMILLKFRIPKLENSSV